MIQYYLMKLIADSGSTKTEWILLNDLNKVLHTFTIGLNPFHVNEEIIKDTVENSELFNFKDKITSIEFFGAGCSNKEKSLWLKKQFINFFPNADIDIKTDIEAAVLATSKNKPCTVCILGTGSTFRQFDGENIISKYSSLSYILGDEGSGTYIAKSLLRGVFYQNFTQKIIDLFLTEYAIDSSILLEKTYKEALPNRYLASFVPFCKKYIENPEIENIVLYAFDDFYTEHLKKYEFTHQNPVHFVGSIAFHFKEQLEKIAKKNNFEIGEIVKNPLPNLIEKYME